MDLGQRRIGLAIAEDFLVASLDTIRVSDRQDALTKILEICRQERVEKIVLGLPKNKAESSEDMVRSFALELNKYISLPIEFVDETLTSKEAERILREIKVDPRQEKYKKEIDRISAKLILEQYLREINE